MLVKLVELFLEVQNVLVCVDCLIYEIHVVLNRLFVPTHRLAEDSTCLCALVFHADFQALLWWVKVLLEITFNLLYDCIGL